MPAAYGDLEIIQIKRITYQSGLWDWTLEQ